MIVPEQTVPATVVELILPVSHYLFELFKRKRCKVPFLAALLLVKPYVLKLEHHRKLAAIRIAVKLCALCVCAPCLTYSNQVALLECLPAQFLKIFLKPWSVYGDSLVRLFCYLVDYIKSEAADSLVHPPENHIVDCSSDLWILPV